MDSVAVIPVRAAVGDPPTALFVSKMEQRWHVLFKEKFARHYDLHTVYILDHVQEQGYVAFVDWLNAYIQKTGSRLVLLDIEFFFGFGIDLILGITKDVKIVLITFDDIALHEMNYINALGCDLVTCGDPLAVLKYREKGASAELIFLENSRRPFDELQGIVKDIDVLFFGDLTKGGRREFIEGLIASGIEVTVHSSAVNTELSYPELAHLISRSKVVLNLSKTHTVMGRPEAFVPVRSFLQFKGRVIEAGLGGAACVSEYAPSIEYLFGNETVLMFRTVEECAEIIRGLLGNPVRLADLSARLRGAVLERFEQAGQVQRLVDVIKNSAPVAKVAPKWIPYRYIVAMAMARFVTVRRPLGVWLRDLSAFVLGAWVYPVHLRLLAVLEVLLEILKRVFKTVRLPSL
jgi:Glycosyl transferases group 1